MSPLQKMEDVNLEDSDEVLSTFLGNARALSRNGKWAGGTVGAWYAAECAWTWTKEDYAKELDRYVKDLALTSIYPMSEQV